MTLSEAFELYQIDTAYQAHITTIIDMSYELYWHQEVNSNALFRTIWKLAGKEVAGHIVSLIRADKTTFLNV